VINDKSHGNITKHLECNVLPYYKLIIQFAGERTLKICEHLAKLQKKWLMRPICLGFFPQRYWTRQTSRITCAWRTKTVTNNVNRHTWLYYQQITFLKTSFDLYWLADWGHQRLTDCWPCTAFCRDIFFFVAAVVYSGHANFNMADVNTFLLGN